MSLEIIYIFTVAGGTWVIFKYVMIHFSRAGKSYNQKSPTFKDYFHSEMGQKIGQRFARFLMGFSFKKKPKRT